MIIAINTTRNAPSSVDPIYAPSDHRTRGAERKTGHEAEYH